MKSYLNNNKIENYQERQRWIEEHPNLLLDLLPQCKLIMCLIYHTREFENVLDKIQFFNMTYANLNRYLKLLEQIGFIQGKQIGRTRRYCITRKGDFTSSNLPNYIVISSNILIPNYITSFTPNIKRNFGFCSKAGRNYNNGIYAHRQLV